MAQFPYAIAPKDGNSQATISCTEIEIITSGVVNPHFIDWWYNDGMNPAYIVQSGTLSHMPTLVGNKIDYYFNQGIPYADPLKTTGPNVVLDGATVNKNYSGTPSSDNFEPSIFISYYHCDPTSWVQYKKSPLAIEESEKAIAYKVYPVPFKSILNVEGKTNESAKITVSDITGKFIFQTEFKTKLELNTSDWKAGMYIITVSDKTGSKNFKTLKN